MLRQGWTPTRPKPGNGFGSRQPVRASRGTPTSTTPPRMRSSVPIKKTRLGIDTADEPPPCLVRPETEGELAEADPFRTREMLIAASDRSRAPTVRQGASMTICMRTAQKEGRQQASGPRLGRKCPSRAMQRRTSLHTKNERRRCASCSRSALASFLPFGRSALNGRYPLGRQRGAHARHKLELSGQHELRGLVQRQLTLLASDRLAGRSHRCGFVGPREPVKAYALSAAVHASVAGLHQRGR